MEGKQKNLFGEIVDEEFDWQEHWKDMPAYKNIKQKEPAIIATFKFKNQKDFDEFNKKIKKFLYNDEKVFDGMQRKEKKTTWYPLKEKPSKYKYV